jgi:hypothetical protein
MYSASALKQWFMGRHVAPLGHIILITTQPVFCLTFNVMCLVEKQQTSMLLSFVRLDRGMNRRSTTLEARMLAITVPVWLTYFRSYYNIYIILFDFHEMFTNIDKIKCNFTLLFQHNFII